MARRSKRTFEVGQTIDRFRLKEQLGTGAYGQVWLALDEGAYGFRKQVALKILTEEGNPKREEALLREARICGSLNHPNIVDVYGVMRAGDVPFIIMEYVEGETLSSLWRDLEFLSLRFPRAVILELGIAAAEALHHAWTAIEDDGTELRIVHRDLKPANIMVSNRGIAKVGDFGIAKVAPDLSTTRSGKLKGTPSYMAPELWMGRRDFRPAIDLWSLGIILWELAAGRRFYGKAAMMEIPELIKTRKPSEEAQEIAEFFPELVPIVTRLLQRRMADRYDDGLQLAEDLRRVRTGIRATGDLLQFVRLVRAGRTAPSQRQGSLMALPSIPEGADDWMALIDLANTEGEVEEPSAADSLVNIEPVDIEPKPPAGLRELEPLRVGSAAPNDETKADDAPDAEAASRPDATTPTLPRWESGLSGPGMLPRRRRTAPSRGPMPSVRRESTLQSGEAAGRFLPSMAKLDATGDATTDATPLPRTQSVAPLKAAESSQPEQATPAEAASESAAVDADLPAPPPGEALTETTQAAVIPEPTSSVPVWLIALAVVLAAVVVFVLLR